MRDNPTLFHRAKSIKKILRKDKDLIDSLTTIFTMFILS